MYQIKNCKQPLFFHNQEKHEQSVACLLDDHSYYSRTLLSPGLSAWISATAWLSLSNLLLTRVTNEEKIPRSYHNVFLWVDVCLPVIVHCGSLVKTNTSWKTAQLDLSKCVSFLINDPYLGGGGYVVWFCNYNLLQRFVGRPKISSLWQMYLCGFLTTYINQTEQLNKSWYYFFIHRVINYDAYMGTALLAFIWFVWACFINWCKWIWCALIITWRYFVFYSYN